MREGRKTGLSRNRTICTSYPFISDSLIYCVMDGKVDDKRYGIRGDVTKTIFCR